MRTCWIFNGAWLPSGGPPPRKRTLSYVRDAHLSLSLVRDYGSAASEPGTRDCLLGDHRQPRVVSQLLTLPGRGARGIRQSAILQSMAVAVVGQAMLFVSGPLIARALGVTGRGQYALCLLCVALITQVGLLGLPVAVTHYLASQALPRTTAAALWSVRWRWAGTCLPVAAAAGGSAYLLVRVGRLPSEPALPALIAAIAMATMVQTMAQAALAGISEFRVFNAVRLLPATVAVIVALTVTLTQTHSVSVVLGLYTVGIVAAALLSVIALRRQLAERKRHSGDVPCARLYHFGAMAMIGASNPADSLGLDQFAVGLLLHERVLGLYVVAAAFANLSNFLLSSIGLIASPRLAGTLDEEARRVLFKRYLALGVAVGVIETAAVFAALPWLIPTLFGDQFARSVEVGRFLVIAGLLVGIRRLATMLSQGSGRPGLASASELCALVTLVVALPLVIGVAGPLGAATAVGLASLAGIGVTLTGLRRLWRRG